MVPHRLEGTILVSGIDNEIQVKLEQYSDAKSKSSKIC